MSTLNKNTILVTGATGKTGSRILPRLNEYGYQEVLDGRNASPGDGVEKALRRKPVDFMKYVERTADTGICNNH